MTNADNKKCFHVFLPTHLFFSFFCVLQFFSSFVIYSVVHFSASRLSYCLSICFDDFFSFPRAEQITQYKDLCNFYTASEEKNHVPVNGTSFTVICSLFICVPWSYILHSLPSCLLASPMTTAYFPLQTFTISIPTTT